MVVGSEKRDAICALDQRMHGPRLHGRCSVLGCTLQPLLPGTLSVPFFAISHIASKTRVQDYIMERHDLRRGRTIISTHCDIPPKSELLR